MATKISSDMDLNDRETVSQLIGGIATELRELTLAHGQQIRKEMAAEISQAKSAFLCMQVGVVLVALGIMSMLIALQGVLAEWFQWSQSSAWSVVGIATFVGGLILWFVGRRLWTLVRFVPEKSLKSIGETWKWMTTEKK